MMGGSRLRDRALFAPALAKVGRGALSVAAPRLGRRRRKAKRCAHRAWQAACWGQWRMRPPGATGEKKMPDHETVNRTRRGVCGKRQRSRRAVGDAFGERARRNGAGKTPYDGRNDWRTVG